MSTSAVPRPVSRRPRLWIEVRSYQEINAVRFVQKHTGLMRSELLRRYSLNQMVRMYKARRNGK